MTRFFDYNTQKDLNFLSLELWVAGIHVFVAACSLQWILSISHNNLSINIKQNPVWNGVANITIKCNYTFLAGHLSKKHKKEKEKKNKLTGWQFL